MGDQETEREGRAGSRARAQSQLSMAGGRASRQSRAGGGRQGGPGALTYRHDAPILNDKYFPKDNYGSLANIVDMEETEAGFKYPHLQVRSLHLPNMCIVYPQCPAEERELLGAARAAGGAHPRHDQHRGEGRGACGRPSIFQ